MIRNLQLFWIVNWEIVLIVGAALGFWAITAFMQRRKVARMSARERERFEEDKRERQYQRQWATDNSQALTALALSLTGVVSTSALEAMLLHDFTLISLGLCLLGTILGVVSLFTSPSVYSWAAIVLGFYGSKKLLLMLLLLFVYMLH